MKTVQLSELCDINPESITKDYPYDFIEYIDISSVSSGHLAISPQLLSISEAPSRAKRIVKNDDIIISMVRPNLRSFMFINNPKENTIVSTGFAVLRTKPGIYPGFVYYAITDHKFSEYLANNAIGTSYPAVDTDTILRGEIPNFSYDLQHRIASILSAYDTLIENNRRRIQLLEQSARLLYREWFVHLRFPGHEHVRIIDGVPEGWELKRIEDIAETIGGGTPSTKVAEYWDDGEITWFIPSDLTKNDCLVLLKSERKITDAGLKDSSAKMLPPETILMTSRATLGFFGLYDGKACTNQGFISIIPRIENFRMYMLQNLIYRKEQIISLAGGTTYKEINKTTFRNMNIVIPSLELLKEYEEFAYNLIKQVRIIKKQNQKLIEARDLLLPRLMNGEINV